ncbi:MAG: site-2 protease family protein [Chloroflexota bacterium]|nr:site-2 protease family protein [Chloroflexota bacterium]
MRAFGLGKVHGIDVKVHPTFGLVAIWVLFNWGLGPGGGVGPFLFGLIVVLLIFGCVLLHELGHCVMATHYKVKVHDITLWPFGGVARIEQVPSRPGAEVLIALAGPAVNVAIAVALLPPLVLFAVMAGFDSWSDYGRYLYSATPGGMLVYLVLTNLMLVLFNLLPAFPMDGGRVLRAGLSVIVGRAVATRAAVLVGQTFAALLFGLGLWFGDYMLPIVALFIAVAAHAEGRAVRLESAMRRLRVGQFALWDRGGIGPGHPLTYALRGGPRDVVVIDQGRVVGMLWRHQLLHALNGGVMGRTVADVMDRQIYTAHVDDSVYEVQQKMNQLDRWAVPITEDGLYRGIFTADRFVHVYHQINPRFFARYARAADGWSNTVGDVVRAWVK